MSIAVIMRELMAAGLSGDALCDAIERIEASMPAAVMVETRSKAALRQERYRQRGGGNVPAELRRTVFERDQYACVECDDTERLECDHIIPVSKGGDDSFDNLQTLCRSCNARKGDRIRKAEKRGQSRTTPEIAGQITTTPEQSASPAFPLDGPPKSKSNPPLIPQSPSPKTCTSGASKPEYPASFEKLWSAYPLHRGKGGALKAWVKAGKRLGGGLAARDRMQAAVEAYAANPPDQQFVPLLATWLNQSRYDDPIEELGNGRSNPASNLQPRNGAGQHTDRLAAGLRLLDEFTGQQESAASGYR